MGNSLEIPDWKNHNIKVLEGKVDGRTMPTNDFEILNSEVFREKFSSIFDALKKLKSEHGDRVLSGFGITGSWMEGVVNLNSDVDVISLKDGVLDSSLSDYLNEKLYHVIDFPNDIHTWKKFVDLVSVAPTQHVAARTVIVFLLNCIPFGRDFQDIQDKIIEYIEGLPTQKKDKCWEYISEHINDANSGRLHWHGENMKYSRLTKKMTIDEYKFLKKKRETFANHFCQLNGFIF